MQPDNNPPLQTNEPPLPIYTDVNQVPLTLLDQLSGHWRVMVEQKRRQHDVNTQQIILGQIFAIVAVGTMSVMIEANREALLLVGGTLILYPSLVDLMVSNAAVLSASIHHEIDQEPTSRASYIIRATFRSILVAATACGLIGVLAGILGALIFNTSFFATLQLAMLAGVITAVAGLPLLAGVTIIARVLRSNPDDVDPPIENTVFNVLVLLAIGLASRILA